MTSSTHGRTDADGGHCAFLFTDVAGSTQGWEKHGEAFGRSIRRHFEIVSRAVADGGGHVFKTVGDEVCAVFPTVAAATEAAVSAQLALQQAQWAADAGPINVRMAVHCGSPLSREGDYFGPPVNRVARLLNAAHPGQILLSRAAHDETEHASLPWRTRSLGVHMLKDLLNPEAIFQVLAPGLVTHFPPPRTLDARPHNLPAQLTTFVGRDDETEELARRLSDPETRLVTLLGPPGVGKTRLATQFAAEYAYRYPDGVWLVELASIRDPADVAHQIEAALGIGHDDGRHTADRLYDALAQRHLLLVCDNFEHVLSAADIVSGLLRTTRQVQVLATSRSLLRVSGESVMELRPLEAPEPAPEPKLERIASSPAVALFLERGAAARPNWAPSDEDATDLAFICRELDGLPLAIELAAARLRSMSLGEIRSRLSQRFRLLASGGADLPERQRTLRAALNWSYDLLGPMERRYLAQLSTFHGGFTLEAAEAVCDAGDAMECVPGLHDHSFLTARERFGAMRYSLLEAVRDYASERLGDDAAACRQRHASFYLNLAEDCVRAFDTLEDAAASDRLDADVDNIRSAMSWTAAAGMAEECARLTVAMGEFLNRRGWWLERLDRLVRALSLAVPALDAQPVTAWLYYHLSNAQADLGRLDDARASAAEARRRAPIVADRRLEAWSLILLGFLAEKGEDADEAALRYREAEDLARRHVDEFSLASALTNQARLADAAGRWDEAKRLLHQSLDLWRRVGSARGLATALTNLGCIADEVEGSRADENGRPNEAHEYRADAIRLFREALDLQLRLRNLPKIALLLNNIAEALERDGRPEPAMRLYLGAEAIFQRSASPKSAYVAQQLNRLRAALGTERAGALAAEAAGLDPLEIAGQTAHGTSLGPKVPGMGTISIGDMV